MKTIVFLVFTLCYVCYVGATECYSCRPSENNEYCVMVNETTPLVDPKNDLGCFVLEGKHLIQDKNITIYNRGPFMPYYESIDCDAIKNDAQKVFNDVKCTSCKGNLCNSSYGIKPTILTFAITAIMYVIYKL